VDQICRGQLNVDGEEVVAQGGDPSALASAVVQLRSKAEAAEGAGGGGVATLDPERDLKINGMDLVIKIRERQELMQVNDLTPPPSLPPPTPFLL